MNLTTTITASFTVPGLHHWAGAHDSRAYLRAPHRHLFGFEVALLPAHNDRAVEWHDLAEVARGIVVNELGATLIAGNFDFGPRSCETIATELFERLTVVHPGLVRVSVSEDGEFAAHVEAARL